MHLVLPVVLLLFLHGVFSERPFIRAPANGTIINPGASFSFSYHSIADYGTSSYNYTIWMFTQPPTSAFVPLSNYAVGYYFGRFAEPNYPGNPYPRNPPPKTLTMPNLALGKGFGSGAHAHDAKFYLTVLEEYGTGNGSLGYRISLTYNYIRYNATAITL